MNSVPYGLIATNEAADILRPLQASVHLNLIKFNFPRVDLCDFMDYMLCML